MKSGTYPRLGFTRSNTAKKRPGSKSRGRASHLTCSRSACKGSTNARYSPSEISCVISLGSSSRREGGGISSCAGALLSRWSPSSRSLEAPASDGGGATEPPLSRLPQVKQKLKSSGKLLPHWLQDIVMVHSGLIISSSIILPHFSPAGKRASANQRGGIAAKERLCYTGRALRKRCSLHMGCQQSVLLDGEELPYARDAAPAQLCAALAWGTDLDNGRLGAQRWHAHSSRFTESLSAFSSLLA